MANRGPMQKSLQVLLARFPLGKRPRRLTWRNASLGVVAIALLVVGGAAFTADSWGPGMIVLAPSPDYRPGPVPAGATPIEAQRAGARIRAWSFAPPTAARGTVVLLHGIRDSKRGQVESARRHAAAGIRALVVDSRGHGESSGRFLTYGVQESRDLVQLVDALARRGELERPLALVGSSYGAATAIMAAAIEPRVDTVVATAPFSSLRAVVPAYVEWIAGPAGRLVPGSWLDARLDHAAGVAGFDPDRACPRCVAPRVRASVLLIHSRDDERIPYAHSIRIHDALVSPRELLLVDGWGHVGVNRAPAAARAIEQWLGRVFRRAGPDRNGGGRGRL